LYVDPDFVDLVNKEPTEGRGQLLAVCVIMDNLAFRVPKLVAMATSLSTYVPSSNT